MEQAPVDSAAVQTAVPAGNDGKADPEASLPAESSGPPFPFPPARYLPANETDEKPQLLDANAPNLVSLDNPGVVGRVILTVYVSAEGDVDEVLIEATDIPIAIAQAAAREFSKVRYHPGLKDGRPVATRLRIEVRLGNSIYQ
jgi:hypothetical protein